MLGFYMGSKLMGVPISFRARTGQVGDPLAIRASGFVGGAIVEML